MKAYLLILALLGSLLLPNQSFAHAWLKLKIATTEYAPYTSTDMEHDGYMNHIISQAFLETGVIVEFTSLPWEEALAATLRGEYHAVSYGNFIRSRESQFWHSDPISVENLVFYVNRTFDRQKWSSLQDLDELKLGTTKGYLYTDELAGYIKGHGKLTEFDSDKAAFDALIDGKIDVFPIDELTGWYLLQRDFSGAEREEVKVLSPYISTVTTHLLIPKGAKDDQLILSLFNKGLEQLVLQGQMKRYKNLLKEGFYQHPDKTVEFDRR